ncbi:MAG: trypsin-like peptidase domain-containing protein [Deltaproteobacteria bacterium]|nr:trypsin-like peptidase domain-containing protein [Deltaproteobacteria bacterium]
MGNRSGRYIWIILIILLMLVWVKKDEISLFFNHRPSVESLDFINQDSARDLQTQDELPQFVQNETLNEPKIINASSQSTEGQYNKNIIVSSDEAINVNVFEKVHTAVVNIATTSLSYNFWMQVVPQQGQGTGFIIDKRGYILTNNHVVENARDITVTLSNGEKLPATLVGRDAISDLAVIKITDETINEVVELGDSSTLQVGQKALAIGNPFGLGQTLTTGIISALNRSIITEDNTQIDDVIQTDAPINPGNSGGPLLNSNGEVIGINTSIFTTSGGYQGIGFAIPINQAKEIAAQLITTGKVARPWLGVTSISVNELSGYLNLGIDRGILVVQVYQGSPAAQAGLRGGDRTVIIGRYRLPIGGDIITSIDGIAISESDDIDRVLRKKRVGDKVIVNIFRDGSLMDVPVTLSERPTN